MDKPKKDWKIDKKGRITECTSESCKEKAWAEGLCIKHYDEENKKERMSNG